MITKRDHHGPKHVDVLIVGAGISGIGVAHQLQCERRKTTFEILEAREELGGTWSLFKYPGIRSDSDMQTFGFAFKPWTHPLSIADGAFILDYLRKTVDECGFRDKIRFGHKVVAADFDRETGLWTVTVSRTGSRRTTTYTSRFLFLGTGYYDYESGFTPDFDGVDEFKGQVVHPQFWPDGLVYADKRVVVIGSGATAVTLIPSMAKLAKHVTMLQRSPSYVLSLPAVDYVSYGLSKVLGEKRAYPIVRRKNIALTRALYKSSKRFPRLMRTLLLAQARAQLPRHVDVGTHFNPAYNPWQQRLCIVPNGDLFKAISSGKASVVTDHIDRFTKTGIRLDSGQQIEADIVVTATGLNMLPFGRIALSVDGQPANLPDHVAFKAMMLSGIPNFAYSVGYSNISWTLKVDLVAGHFCRLLDHMEAFGYDTFEPVLDDPSMKRRPMLDLQANYVRRGVGAFPRAGDRGPWTLEHAYEKDLERLRHGRVDDPALQFGRVRGPALAATGSRRGGITNRAERTDVRFTSGGVSCAAWHIAAADDRLTRDSGRPCVVMAHGFGGTRDTGLLAYAEPFAEAGLDVFVFDYRGFGDSDGRPRQLISYRAQRRDYHAAVDAVRRLRGVDPSRIGLWGTSYSAGHVIAVAAHSPHVKAVVSMTPATDGLASLGLIARDEGLRHLARLTGHGIRDAVTGRFGAHPHMVPIVGEPGSDAMITVSGAEEAYTSCAGPTWRNETAARHALEVALNRATVYAKRVKCPVLLQLGTADRVVPVEAARRMGRDLRGPTVVKEYPVDHFDVYDGPWQKRTLADQIEFLTTILR